MNKSYHLLCEMLDDDLLTLKPHQSYGSELKSSIDKGILFLIKQTGAKKYKHGSMADNIGPYVELVNGENILVVPTNIDKFSNSLGLEDVGGQQEKFPMPDGDILER